MAMPLLFTPLRLRGIALPNRVVISPMVQYRARDGMANDFYVTHLGKFALGRAGLIFTENVAVEARGRTCYGDLGLWHDGQIAPLRRVTDHIRAEGGVPGIQFGHSGRKGSARRIIDGAAPAGPAEAAMGYPAWETVSPTSEPNGPGWPAPHALTPAEIAGIVEAFATAAKRADAAGFDVGEVHGAHGYLLASFLSAFSNTRNDAYGGDRAGRMRFPLEVTRAVRAAWPAHKPLFFRVSAVDGAGGWEMEDTLALAAELKAIGVDVMDCSSGGFASGSTTASMIPRGLGFQVPYAAAVRKSGMPTMTVGLILDGAQAEAILQEGSADLIAIGREALRDPFWALHAAEALGCDPGYTLWPEEYGWWLDKRAKTLAAAGISR